MQKILSSLLACLLAVVVSQSTIAQVNKGSWWLGGSTGYSALKSDAQVGTDQKNTLFYFYPAVGRAVRQNLVVGVEVLYRHSKDISRSPDFETTSNLYGGGVFIRKYAELFKRCYIFGHAAISGSGSSQKSTVAGLKGNGWQVGGSIYPGVAYSISKRVLLEAEFINLFTIGYNHAKTSNGSNSIENSSFSAGVNLNNPAGFGLGIRLILPG